MTIINPWLNFFITLVTSLATSLTASYTANYFGNKSDIKRFQYQNKEKIYKETYLPLLKILLSYEHIDYYYMIVNPQLEEVAGARKDWLADYLIEHIGTIPSSVAKIVAKYKNISFNALLEYNKFGSLYEKDLTKPAEASNIYDFIIVEILQEAKQLSETIGYPNIAASILETFLNEASNNDTPRYKSMTERILYK